MASSSAPVVVFDKLGDLRKKYPDNELAQNYLLTTQVPRNYSPKLAGETADFKFSERETLALDAVIVVVRHIVAAVAGPYRQVDVEGGNLLVPMIWADLADPGGFEQQHRARFAVLKRFREKHGGATIGFHSLMENQEMWDTFWSLRAFLLWNPVVLARREGEEEWRDSEVEDRDQIPKNGLVRYGGGGDLGEHLSSGFGAFYDEESKTTSHWQSNNAPVIRVEYRHDAEGVSPKTWDDLREIRVKPHELRMVSDEDKGKGKEKGKGKGKGKGKDGRAGAAFRYDPQGEQPKTYIPLAVVRLGDWKGENDRIRLYSADGKCLHLPNTMLNYSGTEWRLGGSDERYLLYYRLAPPTRPVGGTGLEISHREPGIKIKQRESIGGTMPARGPDEQAQTQSTSRQAQERRGASSSIATGSNSIPVRDSPSREQRGFNPPTGPSRGGGRGAMPARGGGGGGGSSSRGGFVPGFGFGFGRGRGRGRGPGA